MFSTKNKVVATIACLGLMSLSCSNAGEPVWRKFAEGVDKKSAITIRRYLYLADIKKPIRHVKHEILTPNENFIINGRKVTKMISLAEVNCANSMNRMLWIDYYDNQNHLLKKHSYNNPFFLIDSYLYDMEGYSVACKGYTYNPNSQPTFTVPPIDRAWRNMH